MAATKAPGRNIAESERNTERMTLRLDPETMADLREVAADSGCTIAEVIDAAITTLFRAKNDLANKTGATVFAAFVHQCEGTEDPSWGETTGRDRGPADHG